MHTLAFHCVAGVCRWEGRGHGEKALTCRAGANEAPEEGAEVTETEEEALKMRMMQLHLGDARDRGLDAQPELQMLGEYNQGPMASFPPMSPWT